MALRTFPARQLDDAVAFAAAGGQAIHLHRIVFARSPLCFRRDAAAGRDIAHLFDQDEARLIRTVKRLGVRVVRVERRGTDRQHVDLCGAPLRRLLTEADHGAAETV